MRIAFFWLALSLSLALAGFRPAAALEPQFSSPERLMQWTFTYRSHEEVERVPTAVRAMFDLGLLRDEEKAGFFLGFIAGTLRVNPEKADWLVTKMFPLPAKEQGIIIKAIAYSGLPGWPVMLQRFGERMPERKGLIEDFLSGREPTLLEAPWEKGPPLLYTLWGYYVATGYYEPVRRVIETLRWSQSKDDEEGWSWGGFKSAIGLTGHEPSLDEVTVGSTAKWTLVSYAEHHRDLVDFYRVELMHQPPEIAGPLQEVLEAARDFEAERVRKEEAAVMEDAKRRSLTKRTPGQKAATVGSVGISAACVVAGATGHAEIAVPCVVTGALYSGAMRLWGGP